MYVRLSPLTLVAVLATALNAGAISLGVHLPPGGASLQARISAPVKILVVKAPTECSLVADRTTVEANSVVNLTAIVHPAKSTLLAVTGEVLFYDGTTALGSVQLGKQNSADLGYYVTLPVQLVAGVHSVTATYTGDENDLPSSTGAVQITASELSATSTVTAMGGQGVAAPRFGLVGNPITLTATVSSNSNAAILSGTVTFIDSSANSGAGAAIGTAMLGPNGSAALTTNTLSAGNHQISASFAGDPNFSASVSQPTPVFVGDFTVISKTPAAVAVAGQTASQIAIVYTGLADFTQYGATPGTVAFACSGLPPGAECGFSSNPILPSVNPDGSASGATTLTISTTGPGPGQTALNRPKSSSGAVLPLALACLTMLGLPMAFGRRRLLNLLPALLVVALAYSFGGCGGSSTPGGAVPGTPAGDSVVTITAMLNCGAYGTLSRTATIHLRVTGAPGQKGGSGDAPKPQPVAPR